MKMFIFKSFCLLTVMFLFTLAGMQLANNGMNDLKGISHSKLQSNISLKMQDLNTSIENNHFSHNIAAKQQKLEKMNSFNFFSYMGKELSDGISHTSRNLIKIVVK
jgi:hypothetical protein